MTVEIGEIMYGICPICDKPTVADSIGPFGITRCRTCPYELHQLGSYATVSIIEGERFQCEDGYGKEKELAAKVKEMRAALDDDPNWND